MKQVVIKTQHGQRVLEELQRNGDIEMIPEPVSHDLKRATAARKAWENLKGLLTPEEGDALIRKIRFERDHDWE